MTNKTVRPALFLFDVLFFLLISLVSSCGPSHDTHLILATATLGGTYYPVGVGIAMLTSTSLDSISMTAITSAGSGENIQLLKNREADLAIIQALYGAMAWQGKGIYEGRPERDFRSITMLWQNVEHFVILSRYSKSDNISDLIEIRDRNFSIGRRGSGTEHSGRTILRGCGFDEENDFRLQYLGYSASTQALQDGRIVGMNIPAGPPASAITQAMAALGPDRIRILEFTAAQLEAVNARFPVWTSYIIEAGTYPGQNRDIQTIAQANLLIVHSSIDEEMVYQIIRCIYERLADLQNIHAATEAMSIEKAVIGLPAPLHPGAIRFYRERGLDLPSRLIQERPQTSSESMNP